MKGSRVLHEKDLWPSIFFLEWAGELHIVALRKEIKAKLAIQTQTTHSHCFLKLHTRLFLSRIAGRIATRPLKPLAPASIQRSASSSARRSAWSILGEAPLNTISFLVFQRIQAPSTTNESNPRRASLLKFIPACCYHSKNPAIWGARSGSPKRFNNWCQNCREKTQVQRRCWIVSSSWSQKGHCSGWGRPRLASLSAIQQRLVVLIIDWSCWCNYLG